MVGLCYPTTLENTFVGFKGYMTKSNTCLFATVLCLIPEMITGARNKITGNGLAAGCQLFYRKIYEYFLQCRNSPDVIYQITTGKDEHTS